MESSDKSIQAELPMSTASLGDTAAQRLIGFLRRVTTSGAYLAEIDGLRFLAIFGVFAFHTGGYWLDRAGRTYPQMTTLDRFCAPFVGLGYYGVHLFFLISGFVLAMPFCRHAFAGGPPVSLGRYFLRRLTRLEPPYVVTMILFFIMMPVFAKGSWRDLLPHLIASLLYVHNIVYGYGSLINNNAWSLEVEVQFYVLAPILAGLLVLGPLTRRSVFTAAIIFFSLHKLWLADTFPTTILQYAQFFIAGMLLCDFWTNRWRETPRTPAGDLPGIIALPLFAWLNIRFWGSLATDVLNPWLFFSLAYSALLGSAHSRFLTHGWIPIIGGMCYSIYLLHARVLAFMIHGLMARLPMSGIFIADYVFLLITCGAAVLAVSAVFYMLVERPCMNPRWPSDLLQWLKQRRFW